MAFDKAVELEVTMDRVLTISLVITLLLNYYKLTHARLLSDVQD